MTKSALPGVVSGGLGLLAGLVGLALDTPVLGATAGVLAVVTAYACVRLAQRLDRADTGPDAFVTRSEPLEIRTASPAGDTDTDDLHPSTQAMIDRVGSEAAAAGTSAMAAAADSTSADSATGPEDDNSLLDEETGLFSERYFMISLENRVAAARRHLRPVAMILLDVVQGFPDDARPVAAEIVTRSIADTLREADTACRLRNGHFALLLEDTPENGAIWTVERIRRQLVETQDGLTTWAGIACYPAHALGPAGMLEAVEEALISAREWRQDRIEVAAPAD